MGADIKNLRTRIKSVNSTLHLTKAMGLVASSKIRRATESMNRGKQYEDAVKNAFSLLCSCRECEKSPYMRKSEGGKTALVVIAGDRGLAGGYNANIFRFLRELEADEIIPIGKKACERFSKEIVSAETFSYESANELARKLCSDFAEGKLDRVGIVCTRYISMMSQEAQVKWVLPLQKIESKASSIVFEPDELSVINSAINEYVAALIMASVYESFASEVAARRVAMDSAGKNAQQMIDDLSLKYNRARQGAITQEITEIVAGSGA